MPNNIELPAMYGEVLGIYSYRGIGLLSDISRISKADIFDQQKNPRGTQRDLNIAHARAAHAYVKRTDMAFWPEVILCCRELEVITFERTDNKTNAGILNVNLDRIVELYKEGKIAISRLDGNHRLEFAAGSDDGLEAINRLASFCILIGLDLDGEIQLFRDINNNQRRMSTSHLDSIETKLTPEERLKKENPTLYIAKKLGEDSESPFYSRVYIGGKKHPEYDIQLNSLHAGITYLFQRSLKIGQLNDFDAEYIIIREYWHALKMWVPGAWAEPKKYLLLRGSGLWAACMLGGVVIDKCLEKGKFSAKDMLEILESGTNWDWSNNGDFRGLGGRGGASIVASKISGNFSTDSGVSIMKLADKIKNRSS